MTPPLNATNYHFEIVKWVTTVAAHESLKDEVVLRVITSRHKHNRNDICVKIWTGKRPMHQSAVVCVGMLFPIWFFAVDLLLK